MDGTILWIQIVRLVVPTYVTRASGVRRISHEGTVRRGLVAHDKKNLNALMNEIEDGGSRCVDVLFILMWMWPGYGSNGRKRRNNVLPFKNERNQTWLIMP